MKKVLIGFAVVLVIGVITFLVGPRVQPGDPVAVETPPAIGELETWLAAREAKLGDVKPGAEKHIVWADPTGKARTPLALVYLHGFSATRKENAPTPEKVAADLGANLYYTRLTGHGRPGVALGDATVAHWQADVQEALLVGERLGEQVVLIGSSTGATLAVWLAHQPAFKDRIAGLIMIAPNLGVASAAAKMLAGPWGAQLGALLAGDPYRWEPHNEGQAEWWTHEHPPIALSHLMVLVGQVADLPAAEPSVPTLVVYCAKDDVISVPAIEAWLAANPERRSKRFDDDIDRGNHVMASEIMSPARVEPVRQVLVAFLKETFGR